MKRKFILNLLPLILFTACSRTVIEPTQAIELTATIAIPATSTQTPEPTAEPTPTADPLAGYEKIELSQEFNDGDSMAYLKDGQVIIKDNKGVDLTPNEQGLYTVDGIFWAWNAEEGKMTPAFEAANGNLRQWNGDKGRYQQVTVEQDDGRSVNLNAHELIPTDYGIVAEYEGGATALIDQTTGEVTPLTNRSTLKNQTIINPEGKLVVWDGEQDAWVDTVQLQENQVVFWDGYNFTTLNDTLGQTVAADARLETPQGLVFAKDGVLTAVVDQNRPVAAYKGEAPIGLNVYRLEGDNLVKIEKNWFAWRLYEPDTGEPRADLTYVNIPNASRIDIGGMAVDPSIGKFRAALNNPGAITGFWDAIIKRVLASETEPVLTFKAINLQTGELETFTEVPVTGIDFYATAQEVPDGMPILPFVTPFAESPSENFGFGLAYDPGSGGLIGIGEISDEYANWWRYGDSSSGIIDWSGCIVYYGNNFPNYNTYQSPVSGRNVLDQNAPDTDYLRLLREVGLDSSVIGWVKK